MIIQAARIRTTLDLGGLVSHVFAGPANRHITVLHGGPEDLTAMRNGAAQAEKRYAIRHYKISPGEAVTRVEIAKVVQDLGREFGFSPASGVVVEHLKPRVDDGGYERHWHALVPEWDPVRQRVLDSRWMRARQEKVARVTELRIGHRLVPGRWNAAVVRSLAQHGQRDAAATIGGLAQGPRPAGAYTVRRHQAAARHGVSVPAAQAAMTAAWERAVDSGGFLDLIAHERMTVEPGEKEGVWLLHVQSPAGMTSPVLVGALHRLLRQPQSLVDERIRAAWATRPDMPEEAVFRSSGR